MSEIRQKATIVKTVRIHEIREDEVIAGEGYWRLIIGHNPLPGDEFLEVDHKSPKIPLIRIRKFIVDIGGVSGHWQVIGYRLPDPTASTGPYR